MLNLKYKSNNFAISFEILKRVYFSATDADQRDEWNVCRSGDRSSWEGAGVQADNPTEGGADQRKPGGRSSNSWIHLWKNPFQTCVLHPSGAQIGNWKSTWKYAGLRKHRHNFCWLNIHAVRRHLAVHWHQHHPWPGGWNRAEPARVWDHRWGSFPRDVLLYCQHEEKLLQKFIKHLPAATMFRCTQFSF